MKGPRAPPIIAGAHRTGCLEASFWQGHMHGQLQKLHLRGEIVEHDKYSIE